MHYVHVQAVKNNHYALFIYRVLLYLILDAHFSIIMHASFLHVKFMHVPSNASLKERL